MHRWTFRGMLLASTVWVSASTGAWALEFVAERVTRVDGHTRTESVYYRDNMWRVEQNAPGLVNALIVRKDKRLVWLLLPRFGMFKTVNYEQAYANLVNKRISGEIAREVIGSAQLDGHPTKVYQITVATETGNTVVYYQWFATDLQFPLRLARKDADWLVEYVHLHVTPVSDYMFRLPPSYQPMPETAVTVTH